jgi:FAD/FMN-containing dehydrogenase
MIGFDFEDRVQPLNYLRDMAENTDEDWTPICSLGHAPDGSGRKLAAMVVSHFGPAANAELALSDVRALATPLVDRLGPISYCDLNGLLDPSFPKGALNYWKSCFVGQLSDDVIAILGEQYAKCPSTMSKIIVERPHGAALRRSPGATAFAHRSPGYSILILGQWLDAQNSDENIAWTRETFERLNVHAADGAYSNYLDDDEKRSRVEDAYGGNYRRLQALKDRYDPENIFHLNQNIRPTGEAY